MQKFTVGVTTVGDRLVLPLIETVYGDVLFHPVTLVNIGTMYSDVVLYSGPC